MREQVSARDLKRGDVFHNGDRWERIITIEHNAAGVLVNGHWHFDAGAIVDLKGRA